MTEATKQKLRDRVITPEWRANMSAASKGKPKTSEHAANISKGMLGNTNRLGWAKGKTVKQPVAKQQPAPKQRKIMVGGFAYTPDEFAAAMDVLGQKGIFKL